MQTDKSADGCWLLQHACDDTLETIASYLDPASHAPLSLTCTQLRAFTTKYRASGCWYTEGVIKDLYAVYDGYDDCDWCVWADFMFEVHDMAPSLVSHPELYLRLLKDYATSFGVVRGLITYSDTQYVSCTDVIESLTNLVEVCCGEEDPLSGWSADQLRRLYYAIENWLGEEDDDCNYDEYSRGAGVRFEDNCQRLHLVMRAFFQASSPGALRFESVIAAAPRWHRFREVALTRGTYRDTKDGARVRVAVKRGGAESSSRQVFVYSYTDACLFAWQHIINNVIEDPSTLKELRRCPVNEETGAEFTPLDSQLNERSINAFTERYCADRDMRVVVTIQTPVSYYVH